MHILCNGFKENEINCTLLQGTVTNGKNSDQTSTFVMLRKGFKSCILVLLLVLGTLSCSNARFISGQLLFPPITAIIISILNELDNHSHFDSMKHSKGYISRGRR